MQPSVTHLVIPFASHLCAPGFSAEDVASLDGFDLPNLQKLLSRMKLESTDSGDEQSMSPPHERVLAGLCGLDAADGRAAWAAFAARMEGMDTGDHAWAILTPCYWKVGVQQVLMDNPRHLQMSDWESGAFLAAMQPFFSEDGIAIEAQTSGNDTSAARWLAHGDMFRGLASASLDRVIGQMLDPWMPSLDSAPGARGIRRLQSEMQMLLYTHPLNDERMSQGKPPVNSFWVSGTGELKPDTEPAFPDGLSVAQGTRLAALNGDLEGWKRAWIETDRTDCAQLLAALDNGDSSRFRLTLCGDRNASTFIGQPKSWLQKINIGQSGNAARARVRNVLESL